MPRSLLAFALLIGLTAHPAAAASTLDQLAKAQGRYFGSATDNPELSAAAGPPPRSPRSCRTTSRTSPDTTRSGLRVGRRQRALQRRWDVPDEPLVQKKPQIYGAINTALGGDGGGDTPPPPTACTVAYAANDWSTGFTANVTITNSGPPISGWTLKYSYAGNQKLSQGWSGTWTQSGPDVTVTNASWNGTIATGASVGIGANFTYTGTNARPTSFALNGTACT
jgi:cellulase/cellobiase CelA1